MYARGRSHGGEITSSPLYSFIRYAVVCRNWFRYVNERDWHSSSSGFRVRSEPIIITVVVYRKTSVDNTVFRISGDTQFLAFPPETYIFCKAWHGAFTYRRSKPVSRSSDTRLLLRKPPSPLSYTLMITTPHYSKTHYPTCFPTIARHNTERV